MLAPDADTSACRFLGRVLSVGLGLASCAYRPDSPSATVTGSSSAPTAIPDGPARLRGAPFLFRPTNTSFSVNAVLATGRPERLVLQVRQIDEQVWRTVGRADERAFDVAEWAVSGLSPGTRYAYQIIESTQQIDGGVDVVVFEGEAVTQRSLGGSYTFALLSDSHIGYDPSFDNQGDPAVLSAVGEQIARLAPDFIVNLGDLVDFHQFGFNAPPPDGSVTRGAYLNYREVFGEAFAFAPHFNVIGNWEGENGNFPEGTIQASREQRMLYMPGPDPQTYPLGGSPWQDYYAFSWGDATFFVLNVMSYTPTEHLLENYGGTADDWTLGKEQLAWFERAVKDAQTRWKFVLIHHAVGGKAGDEANSRYGRGGGLAAQIGEQAVVHQLMLDNGVQAFFYGHDHVFVDMTVDGVHYTQPGSAGAPWKFTTAETGYEQYWSESGWAQVDVSPSSLRVTFRSVGGDTLHEYFLE